MKKDNIINEYVAAYEKAVPVIGSPYRTVIEYGECELAVAEKNGSYEFVTWRKNNGERNIGHYFDSLANAREDFAKRSGLIDSDKLFDESELVIIRAGLVECYYNAATDIAEPQKVFALIEKIDKDIMPEISHESEAIEDDENECEY